MRPYGDHCYIYVIRDDVGGLTKVGYSHTPSRRACEYRRKWGQGRTPQTLYVDRKWRLPTTNDACGVEAKVHAILAPHLARGAEWFSVSLDQAAAVVEGILYHG
jgi:hypothetical protein